MDNIYILFKDDTNMGEKEIRAFQNYDNAQKAMQEDWENTLKDWGDTAQAHCDEQAAETESTNKYISWEIRTVIPED